MNKQLLPPFNADTARLKVRAAEDGWNSRDPNKVALAYSQNSRWRNRNEFIKDRDEIKAFLTKKWVKENDYRLIKEMFAFGRNRISVRFAYEYRDGDGNWFRAYGNENWVFDEEGLMTERHASINDMAIKADERLFRWARGNNSRRPENHPGLSELGL